MNPKKPTRVARLALASAALLLVGACGGDDDDSDQVGNATEETSPATRTIEIEMHDIAFSTDQVDVQAGETVRFLFRNTGKIKHDAFIGDSAAQDAHEMEMREQDASGGMERMGDGESSGQSDTALTLDPGETGALTRMFQDGDHLVIGCHQPGHFQAGMKMTVNVS